MASESIPISRSRPPISTPLAGAVIAGAAVRLLLLGSKSLWLDEMLTIRVAEGGLEAIVEGGGYRFYHPPLYFSLLEYWLALGQNETLLRLPSALFGVLAIGVAYFLAKELFGARSGLTAAWLLAVAPALVWYSQEARGYSLLTFLALLSTYAFVKLFRKPNIGWWLLTVVATAAALYTHYVAFSLLAIQPALALALSLYEQANLRRGAAVGLAWMAIPLAYLPWARTPAAAIFGELFRGKRTFIVGNYQFLLDRPVYQLLFIGVAVLLALLVVAFAVLRSRVDRARRLANSLRRNKVAQGLSILSFLALLVVSVIPRGYSIKRQLLILLPFVLIIYAWFWPWARERRTLLAALISLSLLASLINVVAVPKTQWRETAQYVDRHSRPADIVLLVPAYMNESFNYYRQAELRVENVTPDQATKRLPEIVTESGRIWLISHRRDIGDPNAVIGSWLQQHGTLRDEVHYYNIRMELFEIDPAGDG